jgi:hypothetical protein
MLTATPRAPPVWKGPEAARWIYYALGVIIHQR